MNTLLERIAYILRSSSAGKSGTISDDGAPTVDFSVSLSDLGSFMEPARAILQAIRERTPDMIAAGTEVIRNIHEGESEQAFASDAANTWRFMITAALDEH